MGVFSVPVTIGVDGEEIAENIHKNVEEQVVKKITDEVKEIIYQKKSYYSGTDEKQPLRRMIISEVRDCIKLNEEFIIKEAAKELVNKMSRSKTYKEALKEVAEEVKK